jgi:hypothetical protein
MAMPLKHIAFTGLSRSEHDAWVKSQARWLQLSQESGGLRSAWAALQNDQARAVFDWESEEALKEFMEHSHERALADAGTVGRSAVLYVAPVLDMGPRGEAAYVGEAIAWLKDGSDAAWLESQREWSTAVRACEGFVGGNVARGRRTYITTTFWRDRESHDRFLRDVVPGLRARTSDEQVARLTRFSGEIISSLCR